MTVGNALRLSGLHSADAELLMAHVLSQSRTWVLGHGNEELTSEQEGRWQSVVARRLLHEPVAYITGQKEFYGRIFAVSPAVLIPRPATEILISQTLKMLNGEEGTVIDADADIVVWSEQVHANIIPTTVIDGGTGSGCIAITLACELPHIKLVACDTSDDALVLAQKNARAHNVADRIDFRKESMMETVNNMHEPFVLVSNPPYIPSDETLMADVRDFEPHQALFAGKKGADVLHPLVKTAGQNPQCAGFIVECREEQIKLL